MPRPPIYEPNANGPWTPWERQMLISQGILSVQLDRIIALLEEFDDDDGEPLPEPIVDEFREFTSWDGVSAQMQPDPKTTEGGVVHHLPPRRTAG